MGFFGLCNLIYTFLYHSDGEFDRKSGGECPWNLSASSDNVPVNFCIQPEGFLPCTEVRRLLRKNVNTTQMLFFHYWVFYFWQIQNIETLSCVAFTVQWVLSNSNFRTQHVKGINIQHTLQQLIHIERSLLSLNMTNSTGIHETIILKNFLTICSNQYQTGYFELLRACRSDDINITNRLRQRNTCCWIPQVYFGLNKTPWWKSNCFRQSFIFILVHFKFSLMFVLLSTDRCWN